MEAVWYVIQTMDEKAGTFGPFTDLQAALNFLNNTMFPWSDELDSIEIVKEYEDVS